MKKIKKFYLNELSTLTNIEMSNIMGGDTNIVHTYSITCPVNTLKHDQTIYCKGNSGVTKETWINCYFENPFQSRYLDCHGNSYIWGYLPK